jgi:hypothetical protein
MIHRQQEDTQADGNLAIHVFNTLGQALGAIPALLDVGDSHASQLAAVVVGGGFSDAVFDAMKPASEDKTKVP